MRAIRARKIRKQVYGEDYSPRLRDYSQSGPNSNRSFTVIEKGKSVKKWYSIAGMRVADTKRQRYQHAKKEWNHG